MKSLRLPALVLLTALFIPHGSSATSLSATADHTINVGGGKSVVFSLPATWTIVPSEVPQDVAALGKTVQLRPKNSSANAICSITLIVPPDDRLANHAALKEALIASGEQFVDDTIEGKVTPVEFRTPHAFGYSAVFTDKNMIGKPSEPGNYKVAATVVLYLPAQIVVTATLLCDDAKGADFAAMMAVLRTLDAHSSAGAM